MTGQGPGDRRVLRRDQSGERVGVVGPHLPGREGQLRRSRRIGVPQGIRQRHHLLELGGAALVLGTGLRPERHRTHHDGDDGGERERGHHGPLHPRLSTDLPFRRLEEVLGRGRQRRRDRRDPTGFRSGGAVRPVGRVFGQQVETTTVVEQTVIAVGVLPVHRIGLDLLPQRRVRPVLLDPGLEPGPRVDDRVVDELDIVAVDHEDPRVDEVVDDAPRGPGVVALERHELAQGPSDLDVGAGTRDVHEVDHHRPRQDAALFVELSPGALGGRGDRAQHSPVAR